jgi:hypothetical protein
MIVLSYGFQQPENGDPGSVWFPALNADIQKLNDHTHDGTDSSLLNLSAFIGGSVAVLAANWVLDVPGRYKQLVVVPTGYDYDNFTPSTRLANGDIAYPRIDRVSGTSFNIFTLDNTQGFTVIFR